MSAQDDEQQTALDLAVLCEHEDVVTYLGSVSGQTGKV